MLIVTIDRVPKMVGMLYVYNNKPVYNIAETRADFRSNDMLKWPLNGPGSIYLKAQRKCVFFFPKYCILEK